MQFLFCFFYDFCFCKDLLVYYLIKLLDSSCVLFFLVTIFVCRTIRNKSELKAKTGRDRLETENDLLRVEICTETERINNHTPFSLCHARKIK